MKTLPFSKVKIEENLVCKRTLGFDQEEYKLRATKKQPSTMHDFRKLHQLQTAGSVSVLLRVVAAQGNCPKEFECLDCDILKAPDRKSQLPPTHSFHGFFHVFWILLRQPVDGRLTLQWLTLSDTHASVFPKSFGILSRIFLGCNWQMGA